MFVIPCLPFLGRVHGPVALSEASVWIPSEELFLLAGY